MNNTLNFRIRRQRIATTRAQHLVLAPLLICAGCAGAPRLQTNHAIAPTFDPAIFFAGMTEGQGRLRIIFRNPQNTLVEGRGHVDPDGTIVLDQTVRLGDKPTTKREWRLRRIAPGRYAGTLTDANGPVIGSVRGSRLHLAFTMKGGLKAEQWLDLQPGGKVAQNRMIVRKLGVVVARLHETITRQTQK